MKKVSIIYWSNGGNVEIIANAIAEGASSEEVQIELKYVEDATVEDVIEADAIAFGSPAMINDEIEEIDMKPFIESLINENIKGKPIVLFGSCGWRDPIFMDNWSDKMISYGFEVLGKLVVKDSVEKDDIEIAKQLGKSLVRG